MGAPIHSARLDAAPAVRSRARWMSMPVACASLVIAAALLVGLAVYAGSRGGRAVDESVLNFFDQQTGNRDLLWFADKVNGSLVLCGLVWGAVLVAIAIVRLRDYIAAIAVPMLPVGAALAAMAIKNAVAVHHGALGSSIVVSLDHTWPSTHAAALAGLAIASVCVVPRVAWAAVGVRVAVVMSLCLVLAAAHFPSDVLAGWLVAVCWAAVLTLPVALLQRLRIAVHGPSNAAGTTAMPSARR
jgi:membrane-associated phospholipid phosphatase